MVNNIKCPCCEEESTREEWDKLRGEDFLYCPVCKNTCTYGEFKEEDFN